MERGLDSLFQHAETLFMQEDRSWLELYPSNNFPQFLFGLKLHNLEYNFVDPLQRRDAPWTTPANSRLRLSIIDSTPVQQVVLRQRFLSFLIRLISQQIFPVLRTESARPTWHFLFCLHKLFASYSNACTYLVTWCKGIPGIDMESGYKIFEEFVIASFFDVCVKAVVNLVAGEREVAEKVKNADDRGQRLPLRANFELFMGLLSCLPNCDIWFELLQTALEDEALISHRRGCQYLSLESAIPAEYLQRLLYLNGAEMGVIGEALEIIETIRDLLLNWGDDPAVNRGLKKCFGSGMINALLSRRAAGLNV